MASAAMHAFASFFGTDEMPFYATRCSRRIWAGIHFRNADVQAATLGGDAERYIHTHYFAAAH